MSIICALTACSEDITIDETLEEPIHAISPGEPGSADELIYEFYERYGSMVYYDFTEDFIRQEWTSLWTGSYVPVQKGNEEYVKKMLTFLQENLFNNYTDDFVRKNLAYKIFFVESCTANSLSDDPVDFTASEHKYIIANVGPQMDDFTDTKWNEILNAVFNEFIMSIYNSATLKPTEFLNLRSSSILIFPAEDPLGEYTDSEYACYTEGYIRTMLILGQPSTLRPEEPQDFSDYLTMLTTSTKAELTNLLTRFDLVRNRALALVPYLNNTMGINVVETQNKNCPQDPIPEDFFSQF